RRGDLGEALGRLEKCGADAAVVDLCRECLAGESLWRSRYAVVVAERLAFCQAAGRVRLREAQLGPGLGGAKRWEKVTGRRLRVGWGWAGVVLRGGGLVAWWQWQQHGYLDRRGQSS